MKTVHKNFHLISQPVDFVCATDAKLQDGEHQSCTSNINVAEQLSGSKAREIYESIISEPNQSKLDFHQCQTRYEFQNRNTSHHPKRKVNPLFEDRKPKISKKQCKSSPAQNKTELFKAAENGWLLDVQTILNNNLVDIDATDQYKWTALMMASYGGHGDIVFRLLTKGAQWQNMIDESGNDAYDLANLGGHPHIAHMLSHSKSLIKFVGQQRTLDLALAHVKKEKIWCDVCNCPYSATATGEESSNSHLSSVLHRFSAHQQEPAPSRATFFLGSDNKGYKMMRNRGWDEASGLGPQGSGKKYPVKTILKHDRHGFGCSARSQKARVTHFAANDDSAVKNTPIKRAKRSSKKTIKRDKELEIDFRRSFY